jgi:hypothetical protein
MSNEIVSFAKKYKDVIILVTLILTGLGIIGATNRWVGKHEEITLDQDRRITSIEKREAQRDSVLYSLSANQKGIALIVSALQDRANAWETEHIQLMQMHLIYPKKLYRGDIK